MMTMMTVMMMTMVTRDIGVTHYDDGLWVAKMSTIQRECEHDGLRLLILEGDDSTGNSWSPILPIMQRECGHDGFRMAMNDDDDDEFTGYSMCLLIIMMQTRV